MAGRDRDRDDTGIPVSDRQAKQATRGSVSSPVSIMIIIPIPPISCCKRTAAESRGAVIRYATQLRGRLSVL